jgi:hypothetical protein
MPVLLWNPAAMTLAFPIPIDPDALLAGLNPGDAIEQMQANFVMVSYQAGMEEYRHAARREVPVEMASAMRKNGLALLRFAAQMLRRLEQRQGWEPPLARRKRDAAVRRSGATGAMAADAGLMAAAGAIANAPGLPEPPPNAALGAAPEAAPVATPEATATATQAAPDATPAQPPEAPNAPAAAPTADTAPAQSAEAPNAPVVTPEADATPAQPSEAPNAPAAAPTADTAPAQSAEAPNAPAAAPEVDATPAPPSEAPNAPAAAPTADTAPAHSAVAPNAPAAAPPADATPAAERPRKPASHAPARKRDSRAEPIPEIDWPEDFESLSMEEIVALGQRATERTAALLASVGAKPAPLGSLFTPDMLTMLLGGGVKGAGPGR